MAETFQHRVVTWWASERNGIAKSSSVPSAIHFTAPPEFGGLEGRWTPEDLFLSAVASCYTTTLRALSERSKFEYTDLEVTAEGTVRKADSGYAFSEITLTVNLTIPSEEEQEKALRLMHKAMDLCLVSRAISVPQKFEPRVQIYKSAPVA